ncbi:hypothetical protein FQZ97_1076400 [compost metagenome]
MALVNLFEQPEHLVIGHPIGACLDDLLGGAEQDGVHYGVKGPVRPNPVFRTIARALLL